MIIQFLYLKDEGKCLFKKDVRVSSNRDSQTQYLGKFVCLSMIGVLTVIGLIILGCNMITALKINF